VLVVLEPAVDDTGRAGDEADAAAVATVREVRGWRDVVQSAEGTRVPSRRIRSASVIMRTFDGGASIARTRLERELAA
jgi:hypothetical protein